MKISSAPTDPAVTLPCCQPQRFGVERRHSLATEGLHMPHCPKIGLFRNPSFGVCISAALGSVSLLVVAYAALPALAAEEAPLAFVLGPGSHLSLGGNRVRLPEGARIELLVSAKAANGRFPVQIRPGGLAIPEISLGEEGGSLRVRLSGGSTGWLAPVSGGVIAELMATLQVEVTGERDVSVGEYSLVLTTESLPGSAEAERGSMIDYASGSARLVAKNTMAADSPVAPGEVVAVVLEGAFEGVPASLR